MTIKTEFVQLAAHEGRRLRAIRLRALADAPDAYDTTLDEARAWGSEDWTLQLQEMATFVAVRRRRDVGMARCDLDEFRRHTAWLISMWVDPGVRGEGVGGALVDAVIRWARAQGVHRLLLDVADRNAPAIALYARKGFAPTGRTGSLSPPRDHVREHQRELRL